MRKRVMPRIITTVGAYAAIFIVIILIQFAKQDDFSRKIGSLVVTGKIRFNEQGQAPIDMDSGIIPIESHASVFFGGLEYLLVGDKQDIALAMIDFDEIRRPLVPYSLIITQNAARFLLSGGSVLEFYVQNNGNYDELIINAHLAEDVLSVELPYKLTKNAAIGSRERTSLRVIHNKQEYGFDRSILDTERSLIAFNHKNPVVAYRPIPDEAMFNLSDYIISGAMGKTFYDDLVRQWRTTALNQWQQDVILTGTTEALVTSYIAESATWENYNSAVAKIPEEFVTGSAHSWLSAPYIGKLDQIIRNFIRSEQERGANLEKILAETPFDFFKEYKVMDYLLQRSKTQLFDESIRFVKSLPPANITTDMFPGIFECWWSYNRWYPGKENPFELLANQARLMVSESLHKDNDNLRVFSIEADRVDIFYNLRLGMAISSYGDACGNSEWAAVGRSLVLSALSFANKEASLPAALAVDENGKCVELPPPANAEAAPRLTASEIYPYLDVSPYYPHAVGADTVMFGVWLWTASPAIGASYRNNVLEFAINFPLNSPHYLVILGLKPFSRIQMRGMDYRSDPQFERYNSPGWVYLPQEQALLVKLVNRTESEVIKIFF